MTVQILSRRSTLLYDRPFPNKLGLGELALNINAGDPGVYMSDSASSTLIKIGPTSIGSQAPNLSPTGFTSLSKGESWLDQSSTQILKLYDGTTWQTPKAVVSIGPGKPPNPTSGQLHWDSNATRMFMYNGTTSVWVEV